LTEDYNNITMKLRVFDALQDPKRISSIDVLRGIAIISVVLFHFGYLPYGSLGVDLFFVISGVLIGGILLKEFETSDRINFFKFFFSRGLKIWPSYYTLIILGDVIAWLLYRNSHPDQIIPLWDMKRYLLFYQNYTGVPFHYSFDVIWSLCVEEHFYILFPLMLLFVQFFFKDANKRKWLLIFILAVIVMGWIFKPLSFHFMHGQDTYSGTHNRIDALALGVLFSFVLRYRSGMITKLKRGYFYAIAGAILVIILAALDIILKNVIYTKILFHSLVPLCFFMIIAGMYNYDFSRFKIMRFIAYYSYNWYLWHILFRSFIYDAIGKNVAGLIIYLILTFSVAMFFTIIVEEQVLKYRSALLTKMFSRHTIKNV